MLEPARICGAKVGLNTKVLDFAKSSGGKRE